MEALEKLLIEKYGLPPDQASAYAQEIIAGNRGTKGRGGQGAVGGHELGLQGEALTNVANDALKNYNSLADFGWTASMGGRSVDPNSQANYDRRLADSANTTRRNAAQARERQIEGQDRALGTVDHEIARIANMLEFRQGIRVQPDGSYTQAHDTPSDFTLALNPREEGPLTSVGNRPAPAPPPPPVIGDVEVTRLPPGNASQPSNPYAERLRRATAARRAMLGN
jgi:hypothetical protein